MTKENISSSDEQRNSLLDKLLTEFGNDLDAASSALQKRQQNNRQKIDNKRPQGREIVRLESVSKVYSKNKQTEVKAVDNVSISVYESEIIALIGPSGSGKSTLLHMIGSLDHPTSGKVLVDGINLLDLDSAKRAKYRSEKVGFVFQFFYLQPFLNLQKNVEIAAMFSDKYTSAEREVEALKLIESVGLSDRRMHYPKELSGGQMQRAAIARALMNRPKVILADEPTGNLDSKNAQDVMDLFEKIRTEFKTTVIVVTHDKNIARRADRIISLTDGKVVA